MSGPGVVGKSAFAKTISEATGIPCTELDEVFSSADGTPTPLEKWPEIQERLTRNDMWILDGDLGPYDAIEVRLSCADGVVVVDLPTWLRAWRALWRSHERLDFWRWLLTRFAHWSRARLETGQDAPPCRWLSRSCR